MFNLQYTQFTFVILYIFRDLFVFENAIATAFLGILEAFGLRHTHIHVRIYNIKLYLNAYVYYFLPFGKGKEKEEKGKKKHIKWNIDIETLAISVKKLQYQRLLNKKRQHKCTSNYWDVSFFCSHSFSSQFSIPFGEMNWMKQIKRTLCVDVCVRVQTEGYRGL